MPHRPSQPVNRLLIAKLSAIGDVLQALPLLTSLKAWRPALSIGWVVSPPAAELLEGHPLLDAVHLCPIKDWTRALAKPWAWPGVLGEIASLRAEIARCGYDVVLDAQGLQKSAIWGVLAGIPRRIGPVGAREGATWAYTHPVPISQTAWFDPAVPISVHFQTLLQAVGCPVWETTGLLPPVAPHLQAAVQEHVRHTPYWVMAPGTMWESKHWPPAHWAALAARFLAETEYTVVWVGAEKDQDRVQAILGQLSAEAASRMRNLCGQTSLKQLQAWCTGAMGVIGSDSATVHLAGAVEKPQVLGLYGPTSPVRTPPPGPRFTPLSLSPALACQPCDARTCHLGTIACLETLTPEAVWHAAQPFLSPPHI